MENNFFQCVGTLVLSFFFVRVEIMYLKPLSNHFYQFLCLTKGKITLAHLLPHEAN